jgi:hypothetical protein
MARKLDVDFPTGTLTWLSSSTTNHLAWSRPLCGIEKNMDPRRLFGFRHWRALHPASCFDRLMENGKPNEENMKVNAVNVAHGGAYNLVPTSKLSASPRYLSATKKIVKRFPMRRLFRAETKASDGKHDWFG